MGRVGAAAVAAILALVATSLWALTERDELRGRIATLEDSLDSANDRIDAAAETRRTLAEAAAASAQNAKRASRRVNSLKRNLGEIRLDVKRWRDALNALVPPGRDVSEVRLLQGDSYDLVAISWHRSTSILVSGIYVWRIPASGRTGTWKPVYIAEPWPSFELDQASYVLHGNPAAPTREEVDIIQRIEISDVGDATGDGLEDLAIHEADAGSGGCGYVKLLRNVGGTLQEAYRHEDCDHGLSIKRGHLVLGQSWHPQGCDQIHGCGRRGTWMRWDGSSWDVVRVTRNRY